MVWLPAADGGPFFARRAIEARRRKRRKTRADDSWGLSRQSRSIFSGVQRRAAAGTRTLPRPNASPPKPGRRRSGFGAIRKKHGGLRASEPGKIFPPLAACDFTIKANRFNRFCRTLIAPFST